MRLCFGPFKSLVMATILLLHVVGMTLGNEAIELREDAETDHCKAGTKKYLVCLRTKSSLESSSNYGPPHSVERQAHCDAEFSGYLDACYNPDSHRCQKRRQIFDKCVMEADHFSVKYGASNSTTRRARCEKKHWRSVGGAWYGSEG